MTDKTIFSSKLIKEHKQLECGRSGNETKLNTVAVDTAIHLLVCVCLFVYTGDEDSTFIMWMNLKKGAAQRCGCGHWFQLVQANPTKLK